MDLFSYQTCTRIFSQNETNKCIFFSLPTCTPRSSASPTATATATTTTVTATGIPAGRRSGYSTRKYATPSPAGSLHGGTSSHPLGLPPPPPAGPRASVAPRGRSLDLLLARRRGPVCGGSPPHDRGLLSPPNEICVAAS
uniref:Uncharacterized protein n=1 Tax=Oryza brachyantha TaxID=4533 RepID=J3MCU8_ORYBR